MSGQAPRRSFKSAAAVAAAIVWTLLVDAVSAQSLTSSPLPPPNPRASAAAASPAPPPAPRSSSTAAALPDAGPADPSAVPPSAGPAAEASAFDPAGIAASLEDDAAGVEPDAPASPAASEDRADDGADSAAPTAGPAFPPPAAGLRVPAPNPLRTATEAARPSPEEPSAGEEAPVLEAAAPSIEDQSEDVAQEGLGEEPARFDFPPPEDGVRVPAPNPRAAASPRAATSATAAAALDGPVARAERPRQLPTPRPEGLSPTARTAGAASAVRLTPSEDIPAGLRGRVSVADAPSALAALNAPRPRLRPAAPPRRTTRAAPAAQPREARGAPPRAAGGAEAGELDLSGMTLLGVISGPDGRRALLRLPTGAIRRVREGQTVDGWRIAAIGGDSVRIADATRVRTLRMP